MVRILLCAFTRFCLAFKGWLKSCLWTALFSHRGTVHVPLVTPRNTPGTTLVLVLFISAFWVRNLPETRKMDIWGTNMYCTAFVSQGMSSFSEVCLERFRDNERGKQNDHKLGQEGAKNYTFY